MCRQCSWGKFVNNKERLTVCNRCGLILTMEYMKTQRNQSTYWRLFFSTLTTALKDPSIHFCLPIAQYHYNSATNTSGYLSGVAARIQMEFPSAIMHTVLPVALILYVCRRLAVNVFDPRCTQFGNGASITYLIFSYMFFFVCNSSNPAISGISKP